jgi:HlyD family secretion protein
MRISLLRLRNVAAGAVLFACLPGFAWAASQSGQSGSIGGNGKIEPRGGVVLLSGVLGATVQAINVRVGDVVKRGQLLMVLDDTSAAISERLAETSLAQAQAHAKQSISDEALALRLAEERARTAIKSASDYRSLGSENVSGRQMSDLEMAAAEARTALQVEQSKEQQVRADAKVNVDSAVKSLQLAKLKLTSYRIVAPSDGVILRIDQRVGENLTGGPAIEMGDITTMYVTGRIFQGDLAKIKPGMRATVKSSALPKSLMGTVERVGRLIDTNAQLGDVRIRLDDANLASRLVGMEVEVQIAR